MRSGLAAKVFVGMSLLVSALSIAGGLAWLLGAFEPDAGGTAMTIGVGITLLAAGILTPLGLWLTRRLQAKGSSLAAVCSVPLGICFWWTGVAPLLSLGVVVLGVRRARKSARERVPAS